MAGQNRKDNAISAVGPPLPFAARARSLEPSGTHRSVSICEPTPAPTRPPVTTPHATASPRVQKFHEGKWQLPGSTGRADPRAARISAPTTEPATTLFRRPSLTSTWVTDLTGIFRGGPLSGARVRKASSTATTAPWRRGVAEDSTRTRRPALNVEMRDSRVGSCERPGATQPSNATMTHMTRTPHMIQSPFQIMQFVRPAGSLSVGEARRGTTLRLPPLLDPAFLSGGPPPRFQQDPLSNRRVPRFTRAACNTTVG